MKLVYQLARLIVSQTKRYLGLNNRSVRYARAIPTHKLKRLRPLSPTANYYSFQEERPVVYATVIRVTDGDGVEVLLNGEPCSIRLYAVDAPEYDQPWGLQAKQALAELVSQRKVKLELYGLEHYGRTLATIYIKQNGIDRNVNAMMVRQGHAHVMRGTGYHMLSDIQQEHLVKLETMARRKKAGLWASEEVVRPVLWRKINPPLHSKSRSS